jgi:hypothetical protein
MRPEGSYGKNDPGVPFDQRVTTHQANSKKLFTLQRSESRVEAAVALAGTLFVVELLVLTAIHAGPLWRDEVNSINMAQMPSLKEFWKNLPCESFPPVWMLLLRGADFLGLAGSDAAIRGLGLVVSLFFVATLWLCGRWMGNRPPIISVGLLGALPAFIFIIGANRAYGLASCLLVLTFAMIWRMIEIPSRSRIFWAAFVGIFFVQCVYYDVVFLYAMLAGAMVVTARRQQWKLFRTLIAIGAAAGVSLVPYLPVVRQGTVYVAMGQVPVFHLSILWHRLNSALAVGIGVDKFNGPEIWIWITLLLAGFVVVFIRQQRRGHVKENAGEAAPAVLRADMALYCIVSMVLGVAGHMAFLAKLQTVPSPWYYVEMLVLCAISLDGILGADGPALRAGGIFRIGLMVVMMACSARAASQEAHTRRSDVDLIAATLGGKASENDLIIVEGAWEGITFDRYYHGRARWETIPPMSSHKVHRNDLLVESLHQPDVMAPLLQEITDTLRNGNNVWVAGTLSPFSAPPPPPPPPGQPVKWWQSYLIAWSGQMAAHLEDHALQRQIVEIPVAGPVNSLEDLPLTKFSGYK